jgi:membrane associated rhomboid family serine protease
MPGFRNRTSAFSYSFLPPGVKWLLISNTAVFLVYYLSSGTALERHMTALFALSAEGAIRTFMVWQIFTYMFLHGGILHILFNMLTLWMFGMPLEGAWGTRRFLKYYFYCGFAAAICVLVVNMLIGDWDVFTIGASGAILGLLVAFGVLYPDQIVLMMFLFPIKAKYMVMIYAAIELIVTFRPNTGVSTVAHLGGMAFGYLYLKGRLPAVRLPDVRGAWRQWKLQRAKRKFQVYMRKHGGRGQGGPGPWVN